MQLPRLTALVALICGCGHSSPEPTAAGSLVYDAHASPLLREGDDADDAQARLRQLVLESLQSRSFLRGVADAQHVDAAELARAVTFRPREGSRVIEVGVALDDPALALRVCNAILDTYVGLRDFSHDVRVLDRCTRRR